MEYKVFILNILSLYTTPYFYTHFKQFDWFKEKFYTSIMSRAGIRRFLFFFIIIFFFFFFCLPPSPKNRIFVNICNILVTKGDYENTPIQKYENLKK